MTVNLNSDFTVDQNNRNRLTENQLFVISVRILWPGLFPVGHPVSRSNNIHVRFNSRVIVVDWEAGSVFTGVYLKL